MYKHVKAYTHESPLTPPPILNLLQVSPTEFVETLELMETRYGAKDFEPSSPLDTLRPSTYFLTKVDSLHRRSYARTPGGKGGEGGGVHANGHGLE